MTRVHLTTLLRLAALTAVAAASVLWLRPGPTPTNSAGEPERVTVAVGDIWFCDPSYQGDICEVAIKVGDTVIWDFTLSIENPHTTTYCGADCDNPTDEPLWDSGMRNFENEPFEFTFNEPGRYQYYCQVHPFVHRGIISVYEKGQVPTPTPTPSGPPTPTTTPDGVAGDSNCDGNVNSVDAALVLQFAAGIIQSISCDENADANEDGTINAIDAALILQFTAGIIDTLPPS